MNEHITFQSPEDKQKLQKHLSKMKLWIVIMGLMLGLLIFFTYIEPGDDMGQLIFASIIFGIAWISLIVSLKKFQSDLVTGNKIILSTTVQHKNKRNGKYEVQFVGKGLSDIRVKRAVYDQIGKDDPCTIEYSESAKFIFTAKRDSDGLVIK